MLNNLPGLKADSESLFPISEPEDIRDGLGQQWKWWGWGHGKVLNPRYQAVGRPYLEGI